MSSKKIALILAFVAVATVGYFYWLGSNAPGAYDSFASCLSSKGAKMYGAYWCPHCTDQKKEFGDSWRLINYVECSLPNNAGQLPVCTAAGINSYPTWEFAGGRKVQGVLSFERLSGETGCSIRPVNSTNLS